MSYQGISVREAIRNINSEVNGWFLPYIQRPYVWGSRYENEVYIAKLFDSLLRGYPIGGLIVWNTEEEIEYREFVKDYVQGDVPKLVDKGRFSKRDKWLVYDGQQRLQTLYSCLKYTFRNRVLVYDLFFDLNEQVETDVTGFSFISKDQEVGPNFIRMTELFSKLPGDEKSKFRKHLISQMDEITESEKDLVERNIDELWKVFVEEDKKSLAYFPILTPDENVVNEVFERLNTGGMPLSLSDILFSRIKTLQPNFEEDLQIFSKKIFNNTGYVFSAYNTLQVIHLIVKGNTRVDPKKVNNKDHYKYIETWEKLKDPLFSFFSDYLKGQFKINNATIIPRKLALLPIIVYFYKTYNEGKKKFKDFSDTELNKINKYFIKSQVNDWNLQTFVSNFTKIIVSPPPKEDEGSDEFPSKAIEDYVQKNRYKRNIQVYEESFEGFTWFALKILTPEIEFTFDPDIQGRFNPEIDHIFPKELDQKPEGYDEVVDTIWNMQPIKGSVNLFKSNHSPKAFFTNQVKSSDGKVIEGRKYSSAYNFLFPKSESGQIDFTDPVWDDPNRFIKERKKKMKAFLFDRYGIELVTE